MHFYINIYTLCVKLYKSTDISVLLCLCRGKEEGALSPIFQSSLPDLFPFSGTGVQKTRKPDNSPKTYSPSALISISIAPDSTAAPGSARSSLTSPSRGLLISFSIFIASTTTRP